MIYFDDITCAGPSNTVRRGRRQSGGIRDVGGEGEWPGQQLPSPH